MPTDTPSAQTDIEAAAHETLVASLRNAHALEKQVISVLESQLKLLDDYPELHARLTEHVVETRDQARRLEAGLEACGASSSMLKDTLLSVMGLGQSSVQGFAEDAVLKAMLADMMTEHLEIASYRTLIELAELAGKPELRPRLEETLREEEAMAEWFDENLATLTRRYVEIKAGDERKAHTAEVADDPVPEDNDAAADSGPEADEGPTLWQTLEKARTSGAHPASTAKSSPGMTAAKSPSAQEPERPRPLNWDQPAGGAVARPPNPDRSSDG